MFRGLPSTVLTELRSVFSDHSPNAAYQPGVPPLPPGPPDTTVDQIIMMIDGKVKLVQGSNAPVILAGMPATGIPFASISQDGTKVAFRDSSTATPRKLYVADLANVGGTKVAMSATDNITGTPRISTDNQYVYVCRAAPAPAGPHRYKISDQTITAFTDGTGNMVEPQPLADGRVIVTDISTGDIIRYSADLTTHTVLYTSAGLSAPASATPDGKKIAFTDVDGQIVVLTIGAGGVSAVTQMGLTHLPADQIAINPAGTHVVFSEGFPGTVNIMKISDGSVTTLTTAATDPGDYFSWIRANPVAITYQAKVLADAPVSYVRLEEAAGATTIANEVAGVGAGTWVGVPTVGNSPGAIPSAASNKYATLLDGSQWGHFPVPALSTAMSFEFWARHAPGGWVFNRAASASHADPYYNFGVQNNGSNFIIFVLNTIGNGWPGDRWSTGIQFIEDTSFHHYVFTYDGANLVLYIDGVQQATGARTGNIVSSAENLAINALKNLGSGGSGASWDVDEIAVYDHALSAARVAAHYAARTV